MKGAGVRSRVRLVSDRISMASVWTDLVASLMALVALFGGKPDAPSAWLVRIAAVLGAVAGMLV